MVIVTQSPGNTTAGDSIDVLHTSIGVQGSYTGSATGGTAFSGTLALTLDKAIAMGLRLNLGAITQSQAFQQAQGQSRVARSQLLPNIDTVVAKPSSS